VPAPALLPWTGDEAADRLIATDPTALLIGFALDQQITVQKAFAGPQVLRERLGHLDPARIATMDPVAFEAVCRQRPAVHRFPGTMAKRLQDLCGVITSTYAGDASRLWTDATDGPDLVARLGALPGIGAMKVQTILALLHRQYGVDLPGLVARLPAQRTLGDVTTAAELADYQAAKRAAKAARRAAAE
jgi:uncharacterized HhH-GPD family protein